MAIYTQQRPPWLEPRSAYIHVPFCAHHCGYCDFAVAVGKDHRIDAYLDALEIELAALGSPRRVDTLFFGGGTPTYMPIRALERLLKLVQTWLPLNAGHEFAVEANPGGLDRAKVQLLADFGVNRLSLGAQSFQPTLLHILERDHAPDDVARVVDFVQPIVGNYSIDLIFGVPTQTIDQWQDDMSRAIALAPMHFATYGLTYEKGTRLWKQREKGDVHALDEETEYRFYTAAMDTLSAHGFEHYEISNFARPGYQCRHNHVYWANHAHYGFGVGAARYVEGVRDLNTRDFHAYIQRLQAGQSPTFQSERLEPRDRAFETIAVQLRRAIGIDRQQFSEQTGFALDELVGGMLHDLCGHELLTDDGRSVRLTRSGKCVADAVIERLLRAN